MHHHRHAPTKPLFLPGHPWQHRPCAPCRLLPGAAEAHVREIFTHFGKLRGVELAVDRVVNLPRWVLGTAPSRRLPLARFASCGARAHAAKHLWSLASSMAGP